MNWLYLTIISYLMLAVVNLGDKFIVDKLVKNSKSYAFSIGILGFLVVVLAPWFLVWPGVFLFVVNIVSGSLFVFALWLMYEALKKEDASRVVVVIGGTVPIFTILFSVLFFNEKFSFNQWVAFLFLISGTLIISFIVSKKKKLYSFIRRLRAVMGFKYKKQWLPLAIISSFLYSLFFISTKYAYDSQSFVSAFIWIRLGGFLVALAFLIDPESRKAIFNDFKQKKTGVTKGFKKIFILLNQLLGSLAFIVQNYAVYLGPVAIINALQGVQYAFLLLFGFIFSVFFPKILKEDISKATIYKKLLAIILIAIGLYLLTI